MYERIIKKQIEKELFKGKAIIIVGPRQVGKTTLCGELIKNKDFIKFDCDNPSTRELLANKDLEYLKKLIGNKKIIFIDEAQKVQNIGQTLKLLVDHFKEKLQIIATGSSSINLLDETSEALTGRKRVFYLYPLHLKEIYDDNLKLIQNIDTILVYGTYPEVLNKSSFEEKITHLMEISSSYLYKDLLEFQKIKNSDIIFKLLRALAFQIGNEVSYNELSNLLGIDKNTVERYIDLLEKSYIVFRLSPYVKNKRKEISKAKKIYFYDLGIRNSIINNFNSIESRDDFGSLFENLCVLERMKFRQYNKIYANQFFWRNYSGDEVDLIEERDGKLFSFEFKYKKIKIKIPKDWKDVKLIYKENIFELFE